MASDVMFTFVQISLLCISHLTHGSLITFKVTPTVVMDGLTSSIHLSCKVKDTIMTSGVTSSIIGRRDLTQTVDNVASVTSIVVMHAGQDVASVSTSRPAHVMDGSSNTHVTGNVTNGVREGFLNVTVMYPVLNQRGEFSCEANAVSESGHAVILSMTAEVAVATPTIADLVTSVREINQKNDALEKQNEDMQKQNEDLKKQNAETGKTIDEIKKQNDDLQKAITELKTKVFFSVVLTQGLNYQSGQHVVVHDKVLSNIGSSYDVSNGLFTCGIAGYYKFFINTRCNNRARYSLQVQQNNQSIIEVNGDENGFSGKWEGGSNSVIVQVSKGDVVRVVTDIATDIKGMYTTFSGELMMPQ